MYLIISGMHHRIICIAALALLGCATSAPRSVPDTLTQVATLDALMRGGYDGAMPLAALRPYGDCGLGTFDKLDGEMVLLDGVFYQVPADGAVRRAARDATTPFAALTFFSADRGADVPLRSDYAAFRAYVDRMLPTSNIIYTIRVEGTFERVITRSVPAQTKPYRPVKELVASQPVFSLTNVTGTMIGFWCPAYLNGINFAGYHLHFLTADRTAGGHVLDFTTHAARVMLDDTPNVLLLLPDTPAFYDMDLTPGPPAPPSHVYFAE